MRHKLIGRAGLAASAIIFVYYTTWALVVPFVSSTHTGFHSLFPPRWLAIAGPLGLLCAALVFVAAFVTLVGRKKKKS